MVNRIVEVAGKKNNIIYLSNRLNLLNYTRYFVFIASHYLFCMGVGMRMVSPVYTIEFSLRVKHGITPNRIHLEINQIEDRQVVKNWGFNHV